MSTAVRKIKRRDSRRFGYAYEGCSLRRNAAWRARKRWRREHRSRIFRAAAKIARLIVDGRE